MKISTVQKIFNTAFPFLKLEFFRHPHSVHGGNDKKDLLKPEGTLSRYGKDQKEIEMVVDENITVLAVERFFMDHFNLSAHVFRKSGRAWLETTLTDDWTLKKQNEEGKELSHLYKA